jgi:hypothetical protein
LALLAILLNVLSVPEDCLIFISSPPRRTSLPWLQSITQHANSLEKKILRTTQKDVTPSIKQTDMLEQLLDSSTIKSLYYSATIGEQITITASTFRKFLIFEEEVNHRKNLTQGVNSSY